MSNEQIEVGSEWRSRRRGEEDRRVTVVAVDDSLTGFVEVHRVSSFGRESRGRLRKITLRRDYVPAGRKQ